MTKSKRPPRAAVSPAPTMAHPWILEREAADQPWPGQKSDALAPELNVGFVIWPDFTMLALAGFIDSLRLAADVGDRSNQVRCRWAVMSPDSRPLRSSSGIEIMPDTCLKDPQHFDYIVVVGGLIRSFPQAKPQLKAYLRGAAEVGIPLIGLCTGGIALAECGLMRNRRCCVAGYHHNDLISRAPEAVAVSDRLFVDDGDRITCAGGSASIDLATYLVQRHCGKERAIKLVHAMMLDEVRTPSTAQRRLGIDHRRVTDVRLGRALLMMEQSLNEPLSIAALVESLNISQRQLERLFATAFGRSPSHVYRLMRVQHGRWLLENSHLSLTKIAFECGFSDTSHFIRCFSEEAGCTPGEFRRRNFQAATRNRTGVATVGSQTAD